MASQWQNFQQNLGEWRGSFTTIAADGTLLDTTPSVLTLEAQEGGQLVRFGLRRWPVGTALAAGGGPGEGAGAPSRVMEQDYRSLGRQVVFFASGTFCKGSLQVAPNTAFGGEFGFMAGDRRHRLVQLWTAEGVHDQLVLIREFRAGGTGVEQPAADRAQLLGPWQGQAATISADWPEPDLLDLRLEVTAADLEGLRWLPDGGFCRLPERVSHRAAFELEAGWLSHPDRLERLTRRYDSGGAWRSATHQVLRRA
ncbi:MAG: DUF3598 family protein [Cyanobacteriota bacterium]|nr:DUF3598 family protein [Cyanobacteriota bacterium]